MTAALPSASAPSAPARGSAGGPGGRRVGRRSTIERRRTRTAVAFLLPAVLILAVFVFWPIANALRTSFTDEAFLPVTNWVGLDNYIRLADDERFWGALRNTAVYTAVTAPVSVAIALGLALLLNRPMRGRAAFRAILFFPWVASLGITSIAWAALVDPQIGMLTSWLRWFGISIGDGLRDPEFAMAAVMFVGIWRNVGFFMVMYLAGLQQIPGHLEEAALLDGAGAWQKFRNVTWPLLANTTMFVVVIAAVFSFQAFDQIYVMTAGGPYFRTETLVMLIYGSAVRDFDVGYATAVSWVLVLIVLTLSLIQMRYFSKRVVQY
ncbi:binding-protein-dependent transport systems inner membrane component [Beutenbergia cavernae DSM 12333]|uniref:Binding-protein-dependent transport systems inner membrane component n=1 Tax=Beutenbergia cavernae (strain ATCC BAA-8 / DSM 12333 / CCUG 43141 / JCM 11478 / NBRC 16432 / NCIMB 13614 / HKI 0122) TaxID=471853 RepID=C5C380_BEUC1|nr:sugar ABC transporter permease [Beutenbergia cavernae]ACQ79779.1 binding-protein-dependent transport systems inner membrane component [Beutenbergia cavernae DSM 12333]